MTRRGDRYFDGYQRVKSTDEKGKNRYVLRYMAQWYGYSQPGQQKRLKVRASFLTGIMLVAYLLAQFFPSTGGMSRTMAIPSLLALVPMIYEIMGLVCFLMAKEKWELRVLYSGYQRLYRAGIGLLVLLMLWLGMEGVFVCSHLDLAVSEIRYLLLAGISTAAQGALVLLLHRNQPCVVEGPTIQ